MSDVLRQTQTIVDALQQVRDEALHHGRSLTANGKAIDEHQVHAERLGMSDHSWVHTQIVLNIALRLLRLLTKAGDRPAMVADHEMSARDAEVVVAGGRAVDALRSVTVAQHLFGIENVVVVHHTHCGATSYTAEGIIEAFRHEHGADIATLYERESVSISDYLSSLEHDTRLIRESAGTPKHVNVYGYVYDIDSGALTQVVKDLGLGEDGAAWAAQ